MLLKTHLHFIANLIEVEVDFIVNPGQKLVKFGDNAQEGINPEVELNEVTCLGKIIDITDEQGIVLRNRCRKAVDSGQFD